MAKKKTKDGLEFHYQKYLAGRWAEAPFVLRITEWKDYPVPVLVVKERMMAANNGSNSNKPGKQASFFPKAKGNLVERGNMAGEAQRRCLPVLRRILTPVMDEQGVPLELQRYLSPEGLKLRLNLALDEEAGAKLALIFRLQERTSDLDRVELIARRVATFTREEAVYWLSRTTSYNADANRWAVSGLRIVLGGQPKDPAVARMLEEMR